MSDFTTPSGEPFPFAPNGHRIWGDETYKIPLQSRFGLAAINCHGSLLAVATSDEIHVYDTTAHYKQVAVYKAHISKVEGLRFQPGNPKLLAFAVDVEDRFTPYSLSKIIFWNLEKDKTSVLLEPEETESIADNAVASICEGLLNSQLDIKLSISEEGTLTDKLNFIVAFTAKSHLLSKQMGLDGRLATSFQSEPFSPSGTHLIYMPGRRPKSNGNDIWNMKVHSMGSGEDLFTLEGHTDAIMWTGFSPNEKLIASVSWDKTMRIWDAKSGDELHKFQTSTQNWAGGFSPNSKFFAGTSGDGHFYIYNLNDGSTVAAHKPGNGWHRALSWSPDSKTLAIGGEKGRLFIYDILKKEVVQERVFDTKSLNMECYIVQFVDEGRMLTSLIGGNGMIETYDLAQFKRWRFSRSGIVSGVENVETIGTRAGELVRGGFSMAVWEDQKTKKLWLACVDNDAVRIWDVKLA